MRAILIALTLVAFVAGCPRQTRKTLTPDVPSSGDREARSRFLEARSKFLRDGGQSADFKAIVSDFPSDPIVPWAELYAGIAAMKQRQFAEADKQLGKVIESNVDPALTARANLFLGITKNYQGDTASARRLLAGADKAVENDDERTEFLAALATSSWQRWTMSAFSVGSRLVLIYAHDGDASREQQMRENMVPVRQAVGLPKTITETEVGSAADGGGGDASMIGAVLPLGSKEENRIAEAAVAGLGLAAGAPDGKGVAAIETRAAIDKTQSAEAVDALARQNALAIIGPIKGSSVDLAASRAESLGVPLISLATNADLRATGKYIFHIRHSPDARARVLAQKALAAGITTFAVFAPESEYGKGTTKAFTDEVTKGGGKIVRTVTYPADTKSFADKTGKLKEGWDAIFIADDAQKLSLIAGALAAAGNVSKPLPFPKKKLPAGRPVLVLSLAEGLDASYLASAARQTVGAMLAPGFYPDSADPIEKPFIDRFVAAYGRQPGPTEAYAYDAAQLTAAAGTGNRAALSSALARAQLQGVTGTIRFDADHRRADPGIVYSVVEETGGVFAIRALK